MDELMEKITAFRERSLSPEFLALSEEEQEKEYQAYYPLVDEFNQLDSRR